MHESQISEHTHPAHRVLYGTWCLRLFCLAWLMSTVGCFEKTYADRLAVTVKFYDHLDLLNRNLGADWVEAGFKLRAPRGFDFVPKPLPPPPDPNDPNAKPVNPEDVDDTRQPGYLTIELPGMVAAWEKNVAVDEPNGPATRKAYIYLLSNAALFSVAPDLPGRIDPLKFHGYAVNLLAGDLGVEFKEGDWHREDFPVGFNLVQKVTCDSLVFLPERMFEETKMSFKVFITSQGDMQALVLFVYPDSTSASEKLTERINLCMETLRIPANASAASAPPPGGATATGAPAL